jgi:hypothetical protein
MDDTDDPGWQGLEVLGNNMSREALGWVAGQLLTVMMCITASVMDTSDQ